MPKQTRMQEMLGALQVRLAKVTGPKSVEFELTLNGQKHRVKWSKGHNPSTYEASNFIKAAFKPKMLPYVSTVEDALRERLDHEMDSIPQDAMASGATDTLEAEERARFGRAQRAIREAAVSVSPGRACC